MSAKEITREINALTIMPLPVKIGASFYDILPTVMPLIARLDANTNCLMPEDVIQAFLNKWKRIVIRREDSFVWMHLGGVACHEVIPNFVKNVRDSIDQRDGELSDKGGMKALIKHWQSCIEKLNQLDDESVLKARNETLRLCNPDVWHDGLGRSWSNAAERAHINFGKIRPRIKQWIAKHENQYNLDEPFGGRLSRASQTIAGG